MYEQLNIVDELPEDAAEQDAFAVIEALFFLTVYFRFGTDSQKREIGAFAERVAPIWASEGGLKVEDVTTLIARSLAGLRTSDLFDHHGMFLCYFYVARQVMFEAGFDPAAVADAIRRAENMAEEKGFSPTPYKGRKSLPEPSGSAPTQTQRSLEGSLPFISAAHEQPYHSLTRWVFLITLAVGALIIAVVLVAAVIM